MTRIATRPCSFRTSEMLRQGGVHPVLARLFASRGLTDARELSGELAALAPPSGLLHIEAAAAFLADAIGAQKRMVIVADYDCDGATACATALRGLRAMGAHVDYIVPNRFEYGYGLTPEIVALTAREKTPDIIITVDNGIASIDGGTTTLFAVGPRVALLAVHTGAHEEADHLVPLLAQQPRRSGTVNAAAHGENNARHTHSRSWTINRRLRFYTNSIAATPQEVCVCLESWSRGTQMTQIEEIGADQNWKEPRNRRNSRKGRKGTADER